MSMIAARKKRTTLYLSVAGLMVMVAAISAISARDPSGVSLRIGMIMVTVGAALWLPWRQLVPVVLLAWLVPNLTRSFVDDTALLNLNMALELPGLAGIAFFTVMAREALMKLEQENVLIGTGQLDLLGVNPATAVFEQGQLQPMLQAELARSRRFGRSFALVLVAIDEMRQKFDYRDESLWRASLEATAQMLRETRQNIDRVFHYRNDGFAIILPESSEKDIPGLVRRLRQLARQMKPAEGEPGGPLPVHFGATFFPDCATTVEDLLRRAEVALKIASSSTTRYQLDSAEAPELPPAETMRREKAVVVEEPASAPPPAVSDPVAAAIVDEAYAERQRESDVVSEAIAEPALATDAPAGAAVATIAEVTVSPEEASPVPAAQQPLTEATPAYALAYETAELQASVVSAEPVETVAAMAPAPSIIDLVPPAVDEPAFEPEPVLVASATVAGHADATTGAVATGPAGVTDDFEALLKQMDETLRMIKAVRSSAA